MLKPYEPRFTGSIEVPRETFDQIGRRWATRLIVVTNPEGHCEEPTIDPEPKQAPEPERGRRQALPVRLQGVSESPAAQKQTIAPSTARHMTRGPRPLPQPQPQAQAAPAPVPRPLPRPTTRPTVSPTAPTSVRPPPTPRTTVVPPPAVPPRAAAAPSREMTSPMSPPPEYAAIADSIVSRVPTRGPICAPTRRAPPVASVGLRTSSPPQANVAAPTSTPPPSSTTSREFYMIPNGQLLTEAELPAEAIGFHVRCADHKHVSVSDWRRLSEWFECIGERVRPSDWPALVTFIADLPVDEHKSAIKEIEGLLTAREALHDKTKLAGLFSVLPQLPKDERGMFGMLLAHGLVRSDTAECYYLPIMQLLAAVWQTALKPIRDTEVPAHKTYYARRACGVALALVIARDRPRAHPSLPSTPSVPLDEDACRRILELVQKRPKTNKAQAFVEGRAHATGWTDIACRPGPVPVEFCSEPVRENGRLVAEVLLEEFKARPREGRKPSADAARHMWAEGLRRAAAVMDVHLATEGPAQGPPSPHEWSRFKSVFGQQFDTLGWERPLLAT